MAGRTLRRALTYSTAAVAAAQVALPRLKRLIGEVEFAQPFSANQYV